MRLFFTPLWRGALFAVSILFGIISFTKGFATEAAGIFELLRLPEDVRGAIVTLAAFPGLVVYSAFALCLMMGAYTIWAHFKNRTKIAAGALNAMTDKKDDNQQSPILSSGGKGGDAKVGGRGMAFGGPGGAVSGPTNTPGRGGAGGSAEVRGDGVAAGGAGGAVGGYGVWPHPAKSGYEIACRNDGVPPDPYIRQFGRGGAVPGYEEKLALIETFRKNFFSKCGIRYHSIFDDINIVPVDYLNNRLLEAKVDWRVRIVDLDEYEFHLPGY